MLIYIYNINISITYYLKHYKIHDVWPNTCVAHTYMSCIQLYALHTFNFMLHECCTIVLYKRFFIKAYLEPVHVTPSFIKCSKSSCAYFWEETVSTPFSFKTTRPLNDYDITHSSLYHSNLHPLQAANCCRNSRLVVDEHDLMWFKYERKLPCIVNSFMEISVPKPLVVGKLSLFSGM